ncbi:MAG: FliG C-terminal domain-containing protein [Candidatus Margulisiibacteriota bacterium]
MKKRTFLLVLSALFLLGTAAVPQSFMPVAEKVAIENHLENRLTNALNSVLGEGNFIVIVDVALNPERKESTRERWETRTRQSTQPTGPKEVLPGIPSRTEMERAPESSQVNKIVENMVSLPPNLVKKISTIIVIDKKVPAEKIATAKKVAGIVLNLDQKRGDTIKTQQVELNLAKEIEKKKKFTDYISVDNVIKYVSIFLAIGILVIYFLNRIAGLSMQAISSIKEGGKKDFVPLAAAAQQSSPGTFGGAALAYGSRDPEDRIKKPFSFISQNEIPKLVRILDEEDDNTIADILSSLDPVLSSHIISQMSGKLKEDIYARLLSPRQLKPEEIKEMEARIKSKLEGSLGGDQDVLAIIENADSQTAEDIIRSLEKTSPEQAADIKKRIVLFSDVLKLAKTDISKLLSRVKIEDIAVVSQNADESLRTLLLENLPEETRALVKEWTEMMPAQPAEAVEAAKKDICRTARLMETAGEITVNRS